MLVKQYRLFFMLVAVLFLVGCGARAPKPLPAGVQAPITRVTLVTGEYESILSYQGKPLVVFFWAKWCSRSRAAIAKLGEFARQYGAQVNFLAVSLDSSKDYNEYLSYIKDRRLTSLQHAFSGNGGDDEAAIAFQVHSIPYAIVVSRTGEILLSTSDIDDVADIFK